MLQSKGSPMIKTVHYAVCKQSLALFHLNRPSVARIAAKAQELFDLRLDVTLQKSVSERIESGVGDQQQLSCWL